MGFAHLPYGGKVSFIAEQKFHDLENLKFRLLKLCQTFFALLYTFQEYEERRYEVLCFKAVVDLDD